MEENGAKSRYKGRLVKGFELMKTSGFSGAVFTDHQIVINPSGTWTNN